jgi:hypothetical protein
MEAQIIQTTDIETTAAQIKERLGKYDFLRITEDVSGLHVYNIQKQADLLLYREPIGMFGHAIYGRILYENRGKIYYLEKAQFDHALQKLFVMAEEIQQGKV